MSKMRTVIFLGMVLGLTNLSLASRRQSNRFDSEANDSEDIDSEANDREDIDSCCEGLLVAFRDYGCHDNPDTYFCRKLARQLAEESAEDFTSKCNPCVLRPCENGGTCTWTSSTSYTCHCPPGFTGTNCGVYAPCELNPCYNNGTCMSTLPGSYECDCPPGYLGKDCNVTICDFQRCQVGEYCHLASGTPGYFCKTDFCQEVNYEVVDQAWRHPDNFAASADREKDDDFIINGAWYRFLINGINAVIPAGCIGMGYCSTGYGIKFYPTAVEPAEGQEVEAVVCDHFLPATCCDVKYTITVKRCMGFTVYKLRTPIFGAYCATPE